jgi:adenosylcobinamide kinase/adenosylcobinamide-phosphate guanylyltransferase
MTRRVLVLGGARSGKSRFAESLLADEPSVDYVATAVAADDDAEWSARIRAHRERRPPQWQTVETADVAGVLGTDGPAVLIDSITAWVVRTLDQCGGWVGAAAELPAAYAQRAEELCSRWAGTPRHVVAVSDEVGGGVVPASTSGRIFRDALGLLNQQLAAAADEVHLVVAGIPLQLR